MSVVVKTDRWSLVLLGYDGEQHNLADIERLTEEELVAALNEDYLPVYPLRCGLQVLVDRSPNRFVGKIDNDFWGRRYLCQVGEWPHLKTTRPSTFRPYGEILTSGPCLKCRPGGLGTRRHRGSCTVCNDTGSRPDIRSIQSFARNWRDQNHRDRARELNENAKAGFGRITNFHRDMALDIAYATRPTGKQTVRKKEKS